MKERIRRVIADYARLATAVDGLEDTADLYAAGMTSHASVNLMLALENEFDVEFPDEMLRRDVFESITAISNAIERILEAG